GARAAPGETPELGGPPPTYDPDPPLPTGPPRRERDRDPGGDRPLRIHDREQSPGPDRGPACHETARTGPSPRCPAVRVSDDRPRGRPRGAIPCCGHGVRPIYPPWTPSATCSTRSSSGQAPPEPWPAGRTCGRRRG